MASSEEPVAYLVKKTWQFSEGNRKNVVMYVAMFIIANIVMFFQPLVIAYLLNTIQIEGVTAVNLHKLLLITALIPLLTIAFWLLHGPARVMENINAFRTRANYKKYLVEGVLALPPEWHAEHHSGDTIDKIEKGGTGIFNFTGGTFEVIETIIRLVSSAFALFYFNLASGFVVVFFVMIAVSIVLRYDRTLRVWRKELNHQENSISQQVFDIVSNISTIIILRVQKIAASNIFKKIMDPFGRFRQFQRINEFKWALVSMTSGLMMFAVLAAYFITVNITGEIVLIGTVYALYGYVDRISGLFYRFAYKYSDIVFQKTAVENAEELTNDFKARQDAKTCPMKGWKKLSIKHLGFSYDIMKGKKREKIHLDDVSLTIHKGEKIALIGESGSGKTTFLKILRGLYRPQQVTIMLDGRSVPDFEAISEDMSLIPQDPELFTATIRENITMGIECTEQDIAKYMDIACFGHVAGRLPRKLESHIKEKGVNLSGGEKQRLALTRGLLASKDKEIIMLDEPTSSVDSRNEMQIYRNIFSEYKGKTIISSIHRLHLLTQFDRIYFFKEGRIIASGSLKSILSTSPEFKAIWKRYHATHKRR